MDPCLITLIVGLILFVIIIIALVKWSRRKQSFFTIPNKNVESCRNEFINKLNSRNYTIKEKDNGHIFVQKDTFSATTLVLEQNGLNVDVYFIHSNSGALAAIIVVCILTIWIVGLILARIADSNSKSFRNDELKPLLCGFDSVRRCPGCGRPIPQDAKYCPYCAKSLPY